MMYHVTNIIYSFNPFETVRLVNTFKYLKEQCHENFTALEICHIYLLRR
jgi:hypothetical protein